MVKVGIISEKSTVKRKRKKKDRQAKHWKKHGRRIYIVRQKLIGMG